MSILESVAKNVVATYSIKKSWGTDHQWNKKLDVYEHTKKYVNSNEFDMLTEDNVKALIKTGLPKAKMLDFGCFTGWYSKVLRKTLELKEWEYVGADVNPHALHIARMNYPDRLFVNLNYDCVLPFKNESYDVVFASGVLQYIENCIEILKEWQRITSRFIIVSRLPMWRYHDSQIIKQTIPHKLNKEQYSLRIFNREQVENEFKRLGLTIKHRDYGAETYHVLSIKEPAICNTYLLEKVGGD